MARPSTSTATPSAAPTREDKAARAAASLREREERVRADKARAERSANVARGNLGKEEAERDFAQLLIDAVRDHKVRRRSRCASSPLVADVVLTSLRLSRRPTLTTSHPPSPATHASTPRPCTRPTSAASLSSTSRSCTAPASPTSRPSSPLARPGSRRPSTTSSPPSRPTRTSHVSSAPTLTPSRVSTRRGSLGARSAPGTTSRRCCARARSSSTGAACASSRRGTRSRLSGRRAPGTTSRTTTSPTLATWPSRSTSRRSTPCSRCARLSPLVSSLSLLEPPLTPAACSLAHSQNDKRYLEFDHVPDERARWVEEYTENLAAPKATVHQRD